jgi:hypothetical protein
VPEGINFITYSSQRMGRTASLVTIEPVQIEIQPVEVYDFKKKVAIVF